MIIEALIVAGAVAAGGAVAARLRARRRSQQPAAKDESLPRRRDELAVSDVVLYLDREFWLAGELTLTEEGESVAKLFRTPAAEPVTWLAELCLERELVLLEDAEDLPGGRPGDTLFVRDRRLSLRRRGRVELTSEGEQVGAHGASGDFVVLGDSAGGRLLVVDDDSGRRLALFGDCVGRELLDVLPGSRAAQSDS